MSISDSTYSHVDDIRFKLFVQLLLLFDRLDRASYRSDFAKTYFLLDSLPMGTHEFGLSVSRVRNAQRYVESSEFGAARFELKLLIAAVKATLRQDQIAALKSRSRTQQTLCDDSIPTVDLEHEDSRFC